MNRGDLVSASAMGVGTQSLKRLGVALLIALSFGLGAAQPSPAAPTSTKTASVSECSYPSQYGFAQVRHQHSGAANSSLGYTMSCSGSPHGNLHGISLIVWGPSGICRVYDWQYQTSFVGDDVSWGGYTPCGTGLYATGTGHRTFDNWTWKENSLITQTVSWHS